MKMKLPSLLLLGLLEGANGYLMNMAARAMREGEDYIQGSMNMVLEMQKNLVSDQVSLLTAFTRVFVTFYHF